MTAVRVIVDHSDLLNSGTISHSSLDSYVNTTPFLVTSGTVGSRPQSARALAAGSGITIIDGGAGGDVVIATSGTVSTTVHRTLPHLGGPFGGFVNPVKDVGPMPFPTASIWWTDATRTKKIVQQTIVRNGLQLPVTITWQAFNSDGTTIVETAIDSIEYNGVYEVSRSRSTS
jgi:hypothetical protein